MILPSNKNIFKKYFIVILIGKLLELQYITSFVWFNRVGLAGLAGLDY